MVSERATIKVSLQVLLSGVIIGSLAVAYGTALYLDARTKPTGSGEILTNADVVESIKRNPFINPSVTSSLGKYYIINFTPLRSQMIAVRDDQRYKTYAYFVYLNNAAWIGLDERELFTAASTIKVPLAMAVYKLKEQGKLNLQDTYILDASDLDENFGPLYQRGAGAELTIGELLQIMLEYSDNTAARALLHVTELLGVSDPFIDVYHAMGWESVDFGSKPTYIDINEKTLANMFLSLYNSTYLTVEDSGAILAALDRSKFNSQIVAGVPASIPVAHKIGIDELSNTYSDCGIVYVPQRPYLLCMGISGADQVEADAFMKEMSKTVYEYVSSN